MTRSTHTFARYVDVQLAFADPHLVPLPAESGPPGGMAWLRATVARFSVGEIHARRRELLESDLARLDPAALCRAVASAPHGDARLSVVRTLAEALGLPEPDAVAMAVTVVSRMYFGGEDTDADAAVAWLLPRVLAAGSADAPTDDELSERAVPAELTDAELEIAANRIGLLVQACDATGALVDNSRRSAAGCPVGTSVEALLAETLRHDPPVRVMRRAAVHDTWVGGVRIAEGDLVVLDLAAANRDPEVFPDPGTFDPDRSGPPPLTFGGQPRVCPGRDHALALAAGVLEAGDLHVAGSVYYADAVGDLSPSARSAS